MATLVAAAPAQLQLRPFQLPPMEVGTTSTGLKVIAMRRGPLPLVAMRLVVRAGSAADPPGKLGLADFTARLLRRGTSQRSADQIDEAVEQVGGSLAAGAHQDYLGLSLSAPSEHLEALLAVLGELVREPSFPQEEVEAQRRRVLAEIANELDDPEALADRAFSWAMWGEHAYGHEINGRKADVQSFTREDAVRFHRQLVGPKISTLVVVGELDPGAILAQAERAFAGWAGGPEARPAIPPARGAAMPGQVLIVDKPEQTQTQVYLGAPGVARGHPEHFPISAFNAVLGFGFTSRLVQEIRVKRGLSYGASSQFEALAAGGTFGIHSFTRTETTRKLIEVALAQVARMRKKGPSLAELRSAQRLVTGLFPARLETNEALAGSLAELEAYGLPLDWLERFRDRFAAVTVKEAQEAAARHLFEDDPTLVLVGNAAALQPQVEGLGKVRVIRPAELE